MSNMEIVKLLNDRIAELKSLLERRKLLRLTSHKDVFFIKTLNTNVLLLGVFKNHARYNF